MKKVVKKFLVIICLITILLGSLIQIQNSFLLTDESINRINLDENCAQYKSENKIGSQSSLSDEENPLFSPDFWEKLHSLDAEDWGYYQWKRYVIVDFCNQTEAEFYYYTKDDPEANHFLNIIIRLLWGTYNYTLSKEESKRLLNQLKHDNTVAITSATTLTQCDEIKVALDIVYYVHSVPWWQDMALTLEVRFNSRDTGSQWYTLNPNPETVTFHYWGSGPITKYVEAFEGYPMKSGYRVFYKRLETVDTYVWDDKGTLYYEHIEIPTGYLENSLVIHAIITYFVPPWKATESAVSESWDKQIVDDDIYPPSFLSFQACFSGDNLNAPNQMLYIFTKPNGDPMDEVNKDIFVRVNFFDQSGIYWKRLLYRFKGPDGNIYYQGELIWDPNNDLFMIPRDFLIAGWRWHFDFGALATIEISCKASDADFDRFIFDSLESPWSHELYKRNDWDGWIVVAQVIKQEFTAQSINIKYEFSNDILDPYIKYGIYEGEKVSFSVKLVNGFDSPIQVNEVKYAAIPVDSQITPIYIIQKLNGFDINAHTRRITPYFNATELLNQLNAIGTYKILIKVNYSFLSNEYLIYFENNFQVIEPEQPKVKFFIEYVELDMLAFTKANFFPIFYKDDMLNKPTKYHWKIQVENPSRLALRLNDTLRFNVAFNSGRSPGKLVISTGNTIDISVGPFLKELYPFTLEINDPSVFPKEKLWSDLILDWGVVDLINTFVGLGKKTIQFITQFQDFTKAWAKTTSKYISIAGLIFSIKSAVKDIWGAIETYINLDMYNEFEVQCLTGTTSWNYYSSDEIDRFSDLYVDLINTTKLSFEVLAVPSENQHSYLDEYFITQGIIIGVDIASVATSAYALYTGEVYSKAAAAIVSIGLMIVKELLKVERDTAKKRCDDPEPPSGNYTKHVPKNYTEVTLPREYENNIRYSTCLYNLLQNFENLNVEKKAQQEIRNRLNNAIEANESEWILFQMNDLKESIQLETIYTQKYLIALKQFNLLYSEDIVNLGVTNQDILFIEDFVEKNGIPPQIKQIFNFSEEYEKELIHHVANASEYQFLKDVGGDNEYSYTEYYKELDMQLDDLTEVKTEANSKIEDLIQQNYIDVSLERGVVSKELNETDIISLESLNQSITEKFMLKEWSSVISLCDKLIELTNNLAFHIVNYSNPILVSYKYYAQAIKKEALENNRKHLSLSSISFIEDQTLEPEMTGKAKIHIRLVNASNPDTVELSVNNLMGSYRFLSETGAIISHITLLPNITSTIYLEYWFSEDMDYGTYSFDVKFREFNYNTYYHKIVTVDLVEDTDTTPPVILIDYINGDGTDRNPGAWDVFAYDRESVINNNTIKIYIDNSLVGNSFAVYDVPLIIGEHAIRVEVWNNDLTLPELAENYSYQEIVDDDITIPSLIIETVDCINDELSGDWHIIAEDLSGILEIGLTIDGVTSILTQEDFGIVELVELFIPIDNQLGNHECLGYVTDADLDRGSQDSLTFEHDSISCTIIDDDDTPPTITYSYEGDNTDGSPGAIIISANDTSGLSVDPSGIYTIPNSLGEHKFEFIAIDNDNDRLEDSLNSIISISITILDDDTSPPIIHISYNGNGLDSNPGYFEWNIYDLDDIIGGDHDTGFSEISIKVVYESSEGLPSQEYILSPLEIGFWNLPPFLGTYTLMIIATDNDDDRTLLLDSLTTELVQSQEIKDDDPDGPILSNLLILDTIHNISISFEAFDSSGIREVIINIDNECTFIYDELTGESFTFDIFNYWVMDFGSHYVEIEVWDADDDRIDDTLSSLISGMFVSSLEEMKQHALWEIDQLFEQVYESSDDCWLKKSDKTTMINKINSIKTLVSENCFEDAYNKLLHDIKPKLTGLKTDENEDPWDGGVFNNPWVINDELQETLRLICNEILCNTKALVKAISQIEISQLEIESYSTFKIVIPYSETIPIFSYNIFLFIGFISIISMLLNSKHKKNK